MAATSLEQLGRQQEALQGADRLLDQSSDLLHRSLRLLRGFSWAGRLVNLIEQATSPARVKGDSAEERDREMSPVSSAVHTSSLPSADPVDESMRELTRSVRELRAAGELIAGRVRASNALLARVAAKQDLALEKTYELTRQTSQLHRLGSDPAQTFTLHAIGDFDFYGSWQSAVPLLLLVTKQQP